MTWAAGSVKAGNMRIEQILSEADQSREAGRIEEAKALYLQILSLDVRHAPSLFGLGTIAQNAGNSEVAEKMFRRAIAIDNKDAEYHFALGIALQTQGKLDEAIGEFRRVLELDAAHRLALFRLGNTLQLVGKLDEAIAAYQEILEIDPESPDAEFNTGNVRRLQGRLGEAREHYLKALQFDPGNFDARWNLGLLDLLEGNYPAGWLNYEARHQRTTPNLRRFTQPQWKGEPLNGERILLHAEQGLGDTIQFLRYVPMVNAAGGRVVLDVPAEVRRLAAAMEDVAAVIATGEAIPEFDWQCPLLSLPLAFGTTLDTIPNDVPYLVVPNEPQEAAAKRAWTEHGLRVGLVWAATTRQFEDSDRSIPLSLFESVLSSPNTNFFSLQLGSPARELDGQRIPITDLRDAIHDFADTAALISHLDLVITVDTSVAHVAGALGKPTWVLLPFSSDWRWLVNRDDSPWYPTARLFRQPSPRDWRSVLEQVHAELAVLARNPMR
jgi:Flp pilus assembly protein TadD